MRYPVGESGTVRMASQPSQRRYVAILAAISAGILVIGSQLRPREAENTSVTQAELLRLQSLAQRQNLQRLTEFFSNIADSVAPSVVWLDGLERSGVVWRDEGSIVTASPREAPGRTIAAMWTAGQTPVEPELMSPAYPVALLQATSPSRLEAVFQGNPAVIERGAWVVFVKASRGGEHLFAPGHLEGVVPRVCGGVDVFSVETSLPLSADSLGGGIFDIDGTLLGLVIECDDIPTTVGTEGITAILEEADSSEGMIVRRYGMRLRPLDSLARQHFGLETGLLVTEVRIGLPAETAGVEPGDIIQALDDVPVMTLEDLARLTLPVVFPFFGLSVERNGELEQLELPAVDADSHGQEMGTPQGIAIGEPEDGVLIERVAEGSPAASAALEAGDRLLAVNGRAPRSVTEARQLLSKVGRDSAFVVVRRGDLRLGTFVAE